MQSSVFDLGFLGFLVNVERCEFSMKVQSLFGTLSLLEIFSECSGQVYCDSFFFFRILYNSNNNEL